MAASWRQGLGAAAPWMPARQRQGPGQPSSYSLSAIRAALARPCVAADTRASGRTLRACRPLGAPLGRCSTSRRAAPCPRCRRGTLLQGTPACRPRTARPARHPADCLLAARCAPRPRHLRRRPNGLRAGLPLAQSVPSCKGKQRLRRCGDDAALAPWPIRCPIAGPAHKPWRAARRCPSRGSTLAPPWWGQAARPCSGPRPCGPALII